MVRFASIQSPTLSPAPEPVRMVEKTFAATMPPAHLASPDVSVAEVLAEISRHFDAQDSRATEIAKNAENAATARQESGMKHLEERVATSMNVLMAEFQALHELAKLDRGDAKSAEIAILKSVSDLGSLVRLEKTSLHGYMETQRRQSEKIIRRFAWAMAVTAAISTSCLITILQYAAGR